MLQQIISSIPNGNIKVRYNGQIYQVVKKQTGANSKVAFSVQATRLSDQYLLSFNWYPKIRDGILKPCELPEKEVIDFILGLEFI